MSNNHVMLDLETLDSATSAVVLSIGAVRFDPFNTGSTGVDARFYVEFDVDGLQLQQRMGRTTSAKTIAWWMSQGAMAKQVFVPKFPKDPVHALGQFDDFLNVIPETKLWGNGADFDNLIIGSMYDSFSLKRPWSYGKNRCYRTLKSLPGAPALLIREGTEHNAYDDALTQAKHLQQIYAWLRLTE